MEFQFTDENDYLTSLQIRKIHIRPNHYKLYQFDTDIYLVNVTLTYYINYRYICNGWTGHNCYSDEIEVTGYVLNPITGIYYCPKKEKCKGIIILKKIKNVTITSFVKMVELAI